MRFLVVLLLLLAAANSQIEHSCVEPSARLIRNETRAGCDPLELLNGFASDIIDQDGTQIFIIKNMLDGYQGVSQGETDFWDYVELTCFEDSVELKTRNMKQYLEATKNTASTAQMDIQLYSLCSCANQQDEKTCNMQKFTIYMKSTNSNPPTFTQDHYEFEVSMPYPKDILITDITGVTVIRAKDIDVDTQRLTFSIEGDDLSLEFDKVDSDYDALLKTFSAKLTSKLVLAEEKTYTIKANDGRADGTALLTIKRGSNSVVSPYFENALTHLEYAAGVLSDREIVLKNGDSSATYEIDDHAEYFDLQTTTQGVKVITKGTPLYELGENYVSFVIKAEVDNQDRVPTTAVTVTIKNPEFEKSHYDFTYPSGDAMTLTLTYGSSVKADPITPEADKYFEIDATSLPAIKVIAKEDDPLEIPDDYVLFLLTASEVGNPNAATATVKIGIVKGPTTPSTTTSTTTPTTTTTEPPVTENPWTITFTKTEDFITLKSTGNTDTYQFEAESDKDGGEAVTYSFENADSLPSGILINADTGLVSFDGSLPGGVFKPVVRATGVDSKAFADHKVIVFIEVIETGGTVLNSLQVIQGWKEEEDPGTIMPNGNDDYKYIIIDQQPDLNMFTENADGSIQCGKVDREDPRFNGADQPQFILTLELAPVALAKNSSRFARSLQDDENFSLVQNVSMYENIATNVKRTVLVVIIEDVNDHKPVFAPKETVICYPSKQLLKRVRPTHLLRVEATDEDSKERYGKIAYSVDTDDVVIDKDTGVIYATDDIYDDGEETSFKVTAKDPDGLSGEMKVKVKFIEENQIAEIELKNTPLDKVEEKLKELSAQSKFELKTFSVDGHVPYKSFRRDSDTYGIRVVVYGMQGDDPVRVTALQEEFKDEVDLEIENLISGGSSGGGSSESDDCDDAVGLIVAVSILSVLLAALIVACTIYWYLRIRIRKTDLDIDDLEKSVRFDEPYVESATKKSRRDTGWIGKVPIDDDEDDDEPYTPYTPYTTLGNDAVETDTGLKKVSERRPTTWVTPNAPIDDDDDIIKSRNSDAYMIGSSLPPPTTNEDKSVKFDEFVEKIAIANKEDADVVETDSEDENGQSSEEEVEKPAVVVKKNDVELKKEDLINELKHVIQVVEERAEKPEGDGDKIEEKVEKNEETSDDAEEKVVEDIISI